MRKPGIPVCLIVCLIVCLAALTGCAGPPQFVWSSFPEVKSAANTFFEVEISPLCEPDGCRGFHLKVINKTANDIEIVWDETLFIHVGQTFGGFMFDGIRFEERNGHKANDIVFARGTFEKTLWPNYLVQSEGGWRHGRMQFGEQGIYLAAKVGALEVREKVTLHLLRREKGAE